MRLDGYKLSTGNSRRKYNTKKKRKRKVKKKKKRGRK